MLGSSEMYIPVKTYSFFFLLSLFLISFCFILAGAEGMTIFLVLFILLASCISAIVLEVLRYLGNKLDPNLPGSWL